MPVTIGLGAIGLGTKIYGDIKANKAEKAARKQLADLQKTPMARYQVSPELKGLYNQSYQDAANPQGYAGATTNNFRQQLGRLLTTRFNNATSVSGGSGAKAINATLGGSETDAINNFAANDPTLANRRFALARMGQFGGQIQNINNMNTANDINYRMQLEHALGSGISSNRAYQMNMLSGAGSNLLGLSGQMLGGSNFGGGSRNSQIDPRLKRAVRFNAPTDYTESDLTGLV